ncbi:polysaccharide deacetylase family protein [Microtetraspora sp. NBRC 16547]|uniref:polysaccharide deacetylase family protein n=1 Tax=Microtetraspora sp. NBRC 16547 TaxID=3030993 RepID=UPI0024A380E4|nr:polysaccharide deacetylase family protein [Microtetraspora sp. NBRC 16547]GLX01670.1 polysaccharide deacetylase [Microtetraspora sp. NBRC 16547]
MSSQSGGEAGSGTVGDDAPRSAPLRLKRRLFFLAGALAVASACSGPHDGDADRGGESGRDGNAGRDGESGRDGMDAGSPAGRSAQERSGYPDPTAGAAPRLPAEVVHGPRERPMVALTFHGAGSPKLADEALLAIEKAGGHATVLAVGTWLDQYPAMARRVLDGGHDLGNHTQNHLDISSMDAVSARREIEECAARLRTLTGSIGSWFRPSAARTATPLVRRLSARAGYPTCLSYDVDSLDHTDPGPDAVVANVLRAVRPGSVVSMHLGHPGTVTALPRILDGLRTRGLRAVTVTDLLRR